MAKKRTLVPGYSKRMQYAEGAAQQLPLKHRLAAYAGIHDALQQRQKEIAR